MVPHSVFGLISWFWHAHGKWLHEWTWRDGYSAIVAKVFCGSILFFGYWNTYSLSDALLRTALA
nr:MULTISPECIES: hypothetical protein [Neokomagataea]